MQQSVISRLYVHCEVTYVGTLYYLNSALLKLQKNTELLSYQSIPFFCFEIRADKVMIYTVYLWMSEKGLLIDIFLYH